MLVREKFFPSYLLFLVTYLELELPHPKQEQTSVNRLLLNEPRMPRTSDSQLLGDPLSIGGTAPTLPHQLYAQLQAPPSSRLKSGLGTPTPTPGTPSEQSLGSTGVVSTGPGANGEVDDDTAQCALDEPDDVLWLVCYCTIQQGLR